MVLPLVDENKPKCYLCHEGFENIEKLREHQKIKHTDIIESDEKRNLREPSPGDVTVF
jgi:hypothetical protein|tara:strand:+ start:551 stop:724 length:174 start_codon:yes stop_codon:yes gene_type:complete